MIIPDVVVLDVVVKIFLQPQNVSKNPIYKKHESSPNPKKQKLNRAIFGKMKKTEKAPKTL